MDKKIVLLMSLVCLLWIGTLPAMAEDIQHVTLNQLVEESKTFDGKTVIVTGEALTEAMERGEYAWVNINDGTNAMGVFMPIESVKAIKSYGNYHRYGDQIEIEAVFNRSCVQHGGDMELHLVKYLSVVPGHDREMPVKTLNLLIAVILTIMTGALVVYYLKISGQFSRMAKKLAHFKRIK
jgi:hypothetical protein